MFPKKGHLEAPAVTTGHSFNLKILAGEEEASGSSKSHGVMTPGQRQTAYAMEVPEDSNAAKHSNGYLVMS